MMILSATRSIDDAGGFDNRPAREYVISDFLNDTKIIF